MQLLEGQESYEQFIQRLEHLKNQVISIKVFKSLFTDDVENEQIKKFNRVFRIMAFKFLREEFLQYLFTNKKIKQVKAMLKYQKIVLKGLKDPKHFTNWKLDLPNSPEDSEFSQEEKPAQQVASSNQLKIPRQ